MKEGAGAVKDSLKDLGSAAKDTVEGSTDAAKQRAQTLTEAAYEKLSGKEKEEVSWQFAIASDSSKCHYNQW